MLIQPSQLKVVNECAREYHKINVRYNNYIHHVNTVQPTGKAIAIFTPVTKDLYTRVA